MIDLRSDTVTKPSRAMREAMAHAEVGDDVYGEDPTAIALERDIAALLGKEAALFVTSGTMGNQLAISALTRPGDEAIVGEGAHVVFYESGASPALSGVQFAIAGHGGLFDESELASVVHPKEAYYSPRSSLVCMENTHNRAGGRVFPQVDVIAVAKRARELDLALHLDGARLWNAEVATGLSVAELAAPFDTVSVCFSKGLGAPAGSALVGPKDLIHEARRTRKRWGGGMRQVGILAAAARYALEHNRGRLALDHENAKAFSSALATEAGARLAPHVPETNIVNVDTKDLFANDLVSAAREHGVLVGASGPRRIRVVTHLDAQRADVLHAAEVLAKAASELAKRTA